MVARYTNNGLNSLTNQITLKISPVKSSVTVSNSWVTVMRTVTLIVLPPPLVSAHQFVSICP